jgi:wyosine [tRNA(Phe)-imidazoG37] synthetase (radical SAM superfamily)
MEKPLRSIFGPVLSRRLGRSLGVDLTPDRVCTLDCLYCQVGATRNLTLERREWVPAEVVLEEAERKLAQGTPDVVTLSGSGEPTLHSRMGEILGGLRALFSGPLCVITNGTLLGDPEVRSELGEADVVLPSLDAGDEETFQRLNRPHPDLSFEAALAGLRAFHREFQGEIRLEVLLVEGINDDEASVRSLAALAREMAPARIEINTVKRAAASPAARPVPPRRLRRLATLFGPDARMIAEADRGAEPPGTSGGLGEVVGLLRRRSCTARDVARGLGLEDGTADRLLGELSDRGEVEAVLRGEDTYYRLKGREEEVG